MTDLDESQLREILAEFIAESREHTSEFEAAMLQLEHDPGNEDAIKAGFRAMHSIKGNASFLALTPFETLTHAGETVLGRVRDNALRADQRGLVDALLGIVDTLRQLLDRVEAESSLDEVDLRPHLAALAPFSTDAPVDAGDVDPALFAASETSAGAQAERTSIRVDVGLLDRLMNLVGELVLARNQVLAQTGEGALRATAQRLDLVTTQLQVAVMKTRMQPVGSSWTRFPRVVRDLCQELGKQARVVIEGQDTELDKRIIEELRDPLLHLLRNAIDHGVETPAERIAAGKPTQATILVRGYHEGGLVNIEISDDGAGVDLDAVRRRAHARLGIAEAELANCSEHALHELLFEPGFSTRETADKLSGRGVGLDVVRTNIEHLGGAIELRSRRRQGTTIKITIPLTLAIIPALLVTTAGERFALPQASLIEIVRVELGNTSADDGPRIDDVQGAAVLRLRGRLIPLADLGAELKLEPVLARAPVDEVVNVVILQAEAGQYGLAVDAVHDTEEIVVKPLWSGLERIETYAGATILGDGRVALILDALGLARRAKLLGERELETRSWSSLSQVAAGLGEGAGRSGRALLLLCRGRDGGRLAVPAATIARLEEIHADQIERHGGLDVIQRGDEIVPLVDLAAVFDAGDGSAPRPRAQPERGLPVLLHRVDGRLAGVIVDALLDVVEAEIALQPLTARAGVRGSMVIDGHATELLDVEAILRANLPDPQPPRGVEP